MNIKTKVITVIIASILILPAIFNPRRDGGEVLGVSETTAPSVVSVEVPATEESPDPVVDDPVVVVQELEPTRDEPRFGITNPFAGWFQEGGRAAQAPVSSQSSSQGVQIRNIGSGIRDVEEINSDRNTPPPGASQVGRVVWEQSPTVRVMSDVFPVGSGVEVIAGDRSLDLVINKSRVLVPGTLLVVDQETFIQLGGDPELQSALEVEVRAN